MLDTAFPICVKGLSPEEQLVRVYASRRTRWQLKEPERFNTSLLLTEHQAGSLNWAITLCQRLTVALSF